MKALIVHDAETQGLKKSVIAAAAGLRRLTRIFILAAVICIAICVVSAAAEDLPGPENPPLPVLNAREIRFARGNMYPVYSGPGKDYLRGAKGKASVSTDDWIQVFGREDDWILVQYAIKSSQWRIGYISAQSLPKGSEVPDLSFLPQTAYAIGETIVTDDPLRSASSLSSLPAGAEVTMLAMYGNYVYIEGKAKDRFRGFVPSDSLSLSSDPLVPIDWGKAEARRIGSDDLEQAEQGKAYDALGMWLRETEGDVSLFDEDGNQLEVETDMRMSSGTALETEEQSLAAVDMDLERLAILAETSRAGFLASNQGAGISIALQAGEMYFRVGKPLEEDESFEIVLDDIVLAIRGTCGLVQVGETEQSVLLASGHATMTRETEETTAGEEIPVAPREMVSFTKEMDGSVSVSRREVSEEEVPEFLVEALRKDPEQLERVYEETGWDAERLFGDDIPVSGTPAYMDAYKQIIGQAATYDYALDNGNVRYTRSGDHFQYALVYLEDDDDIPALLLRSRTTDDGRYVRVFMYDPESRSVVEVKHSPMADGYGGMYTGNDSRGFMMMRMDETGRFVIRFYLSGRTLKTETVWTGGWDDTPGFSLVDINYTDIE